MRSRSSTPFLVDRLSRMTSRRTLRGLLSNAERHVYEATFIGWTALAQSWKADADAIRARLNEVIGAAVVADSAHVSGRTSTDCEHSISSTMEPA